MSKKLIVELEQLQKTSEKAFTDMAETYPRLVEEINKKIKSAAVNVNENSPEASFGRTINQISALIEKRKNVNDTLFDEMDKLNEINSDIIGKIGTEIDLLNPKIASYRTIMNISEEIRLFSLNAMVVALKAGKEGGGFSVITENLRHLSGQTIDKAEQIHSISEGILKKFNLSKELQRKAIDSQDQLRESFQKSVSANLQIITDGLIMVERILYKLTSDLEKIRQLLFSMMEEIQHQDIIKQAIDHVIMLLNELDEYEAETDETLDSLCFSDRVYDISKSLLQDILERFSKTTTSFKENFTKIYSEVSELRTTNIFQAEKASRSKGMLLSTETESEQLLKEIDNQITIRIRMLDENQQIFRSVSEMDNVFNDFGRINQRFKNMTVLSRIEIARKTALRMISDTVMEMDNMAYTINEELEKMKEGVMQFMKEIPSLFAGYRDFAENEHEFLFTLKTEIVAVLDEINMIMSKADYFLKDLDDYSKSVYEGINKTRSNIEPMEIMLGELEAIFKTLDQLGNVNKEKFNRMLEKQGLKEYHLKNSRLQDIINRFTIYTHKKQAGDSSGYDLTEDALEEGDIVLF